MNRNRAIALLAMIIALLALPARPQPQPAVELVVTLEKEVCKLDEPIPYSIDIINRLDVPVLTGYYPTFIGGKLSAEQSGELAPIPFHWQVVCPISEVQPGERIRIWEEADLQRHFLMLKRGSYTFEGAMNILLFPKDTPNPLGVLSPDYPEDEKRKVEQFQAAHPVSTPMYSLPVTFKLKGRPRPEDVAASRWRERLPEGGGLGGRGRIENTRRITIKSHVGGGDIHFVLGSHVRPPEKGSSCMRIPTTFQVELLGKSRRWGPVLAQYEPEVDEQWPEWRKAAREAFEIAPAK